ncbi:cytochrome b-c1 complex subunit 6-1, mitochondrial isoform X1 [Lolium perenne]
MWNWEVCGSYSLKHTASSLGVSSLVTPSSSISPLADEEPVDPKKYLEDRCKPQCVKPFYAYEKCVKRVEADDTGHKHCTGQYFDYLSCVDKCVASKLFEKLK